MVVVSRPADLPDFANPPLNEVVLGVQFDPPAGYQPIRAGEVWNLFSAEFPQVQELPPLPPNFETFGPQVSLFGLGGASGLSPIVGFGPMVGAMHNRFWFVSESGEQLIQFQNDRLLHNWRKVAGRDNYYPRYDSISSRFFYELNELQSFMSGLRPQELRIRQCEIAYINHIKPMQDIPLRASEWLRFVSFSDEPDDFAFSFRRTITSDDGQPRGRLMCDSSTAVEPTGQHFISMTLTARGAPEQPSLASALEFLNRGRDIICRTFADITTDSAHRAWERIT
jgi:uncharacterized protein (TIGR04255 family)